MRHYFSFLIERPRSLTLSRGATPAGRGTSPSTGRAAGSYSEDRIVRVLFLCEISKNLPRKQFVDLVVTRNRLSGSCLGVVLNVVFSSMTEKNGTSGLHLGNQIAPFQANSNSSTFLIPGSCPSEKIL
jgi:hypothetical protein